MSDSHNSDLFEDPDFPANSTVLCRSGPRFGVRWKRPKELSPKPVFVEEGTVYYDIDQGNLGDCWFLASVTCIAVSPHKDVLQKVVPRDQGFEDGYTGKFRFNFWQYGKWVEVVVDDRLPTYNGQLIYSSNVGQPHEYWCPLLEKAYAKLNGNYDVLNGGRMHTAMVDLTGGLGELVPLKEHISDEELSEILFKSQKMNTLMGAAIFNQNPFQPEVRRDTGLIEGHAYSVIDVKEVKGLRGKVTLLHLRNPHGHGEWNGAWSDGSAEYNSLSASDRDATSRKTDDGEFWISVYDFRRNFDELEFSNLTPDGLTEEIAENLSKSQWQVTEYHGSWVKGLSAGGAPISFMSERFWSNPQFELNVPASPSETTVVISLMEIDVLTVRAEADISIGFTIFKHNTGGRKPDRITAENYYEFSPQMVGSSGVSWPYRERTVRFKMQPGNYVIVPYTSRAGQEASFYMRVFSESEMGFSSMETGPSKEIAALDKAFDGLVGRSGEIDAEELIEVISAGTEAADGSQLRPSLETCRCFMGIHSSPSGLLDRDGVHKVWTDLTTWRQAFLVTDKNQNGVIDSLELKGLFEIIELNPASVIAESVMRRYGGKKRGMSLEDFLQSVCKVIHLHTLYGSLRKEGKISMTVQEWMAHGLSL